MVGGKVNMQRQNGIDGSRDQGDERPKFDARYGTRLAD